MAKKDDPEPTSLSEDAARAGVTGHHVRAVLAFGLAGVIVAFIAIADRLARAVSRLSAILSRPSRTTPLTPSLS